MPSIKKIFLFGFVFLLNFSAISYANVIECPGYTQATRNGNGILPQFVHIKIETTSDRSIQNVRLYQTDSSDSPGSRVEIAHGTIQGTLAPKQECAVDFVDFGSQRNVKGKLMRGANAWIGAVGLFGNLETGNPYEVDFFGCDLLY